MVGGKDRQISSIFGEMYAVTGQRGLGGSQGWNSQVFEGCVCTDRQYIQRRGRETDRKTANSHPAIPVVAVSTGCVHWLCVISCLGCEPSSKDIHVYRFETYTWNSSVHATTHHLACYSVITWHCMYVHTSSRSPCWCTSVWLGESIVIPCHFMWLRSKCSTGVTLCCVSHDVVFFRSAYNNEFLCRL